MVEILVISENNTAAEMLKTVHKVLGPHSVKCMHSLVIKSNYSSERVCTLVQNKIRSIRQNVDGILILTEVFGTTQSNLCMTLLERDDVRLVTGYNLPMLIKAATLNQNTPLKQLTSQLLSVGRKYIQTYARRKNA